MGFGKTVLAVGLGMAAASLVIIPIVAFARSKIGV